MRRVHEPSTDLGEYRFGHVIRVRFAETDAMGIVHHAAYLPYLEEARVEWLRQHGLPYDVLRADGTDIAVLEVAMRYVRPLKFDELVRVHVRISDTSRTTFQVGYLLTVDDEVRAVGATVHGCVDGTGRPVRLPESLRALAAADGNRSA